MMQEVLKKQIRDRNMSARCELNTAALHISLALLFGSTLSFAGTVAAAPKVETIEVKAPFEMPAISIPDFSECPEYSIKDFGAEAGNPKSVSEGIAAAIDKAHEAGGGTVVIPSGEWTTAGPVHLKSNVNLHLEKGCTLIFSPNPADYLPAVLTSWEGSECYNYSPLIYAFECKNVAVTGQGKLKTDMAVWETWAGRPTPHKNATIRLYNMVMDGVPVEERDMTVDNGNFRPQLIQFNRCEGVMMDGISIEDSPFWTIHLFLSKNAVIRNVDVHARGHNNDGVDPEMSQDVLIENCVFDQGDDMIAVKAGRNRDGWRLNTPSKNIVVRNCTMKNGHQLLAIGSELSGGIENVLVENIKVNIDESDRLPWTLQNIAYIKTNERRGGFVKNIYVRNIVADTSVKYGILGIETDVMYQWRDWVQTKEVRLTPISDVYLENIKVGSVNYVTHIEGQEALPIQNVTLVNVSAKEVRGERFRNQNIVNLECKND